MSRLAVASTGLLVTVLLCAVVIYLRTNTAPGPVFVTEYGTGPDKWATAWLLSRYVSPNASVKFVEYGQPMPKGIEFDVPSAEIQRTARKSAFQAALDLYDVDDPLVNRLALAIHDIEVNYWNAPNTPDALIIDRAFRELHREVANDSRSVECYISFFESVYRSLEESERAGEVLDVDESAIRCPPSSENHSRQAQLVDEVPIDRLLEALANGKQVTFVDVREPGEYHEAHIPGAINLTLRDVNPSIIESFKDDDYVVAYCIKDFRGFEMAKRLKQHGVRNAVILNPFGIQGWIAEGLPVVGSEGLEQDQGEDWLLQCKAGSKNCVSWSAITDKPGIEDRG
ncbi:MAG: chromate resistance protein ChrB domain-containing protein [Wenzhouxiangellaceae bacterium]